MKLPYKIYSFKWYWSLNRQREKSRFKFRKLLFKARKLYSNETYKGKTALNYLFITTQSILRAVLSVLVLYNIEHFADAYWQEHMATMPLWVSHLIDLIPKTTYTADKDAVLYLLSVIASVTGVTLALFYTILATLASTAYAKVQSSIRNLIIYDKDTQAYLRRLTNLTAFSITILMAMGFHFYPGNLILITLFLFSLTTLFGLLKIGMGVYNFFEPSVIARPVANNLSKAITEVTIKGQYWDDRSFQNFNYDQAFIQVKNLKLITDLCIKGDDLKEDSFKTIVDSSISVLRFYLSQKPRIPRESLWFPERLSYKSYFESDMSARSISRQSRTYITPEKIRDFYWLEEKVIDNISLSLEIIIRHKFVKVFSDTIQLLYPLERTLSFSLDLKTGESILKHLLLNLKSAKSCEVKPGESLQYEDWIDYMEAIEAYSLAVFHFQISFLNRAAKFTAQKINTEYEKIIWGKVDSIYSTDFLPELYEVIDLINTFVKNEKFVEGELVTPDWYFIQQLTSVHLEVLTKKIEKSIRLYDEYILALAAYFDSNGNYLLCSFIAQKGYEYIIKYQFALSELEATLNTLDSLEVLKAEYKWEKPDIAGLRQLLKDYDWRGLKYIAKYAEQLAVLQWDSRFPDLYSYTYSIINTYINSTFKSNDYNKFEEIFPLFLSATVSGYNTLTKNFQHYTLPYRITYQTLLDLMEISGYAYLYAYLYSDTRYWKIVKTAWDNLYPITEDNIKLAVANYSIYKTRVLGTGINFGEKHQRQLVFREVLNKQNEQHPLLLTDAPPYIEPYLSLREMGGYYEVSELFIELYFFTFLEARNAVPKMQRNLFDHWCHIY